MKADSIQKRRPKKIALTGAHGTGKTTLTRTAAEHLSNKYKIAQTQEVPRLIVDAVGDKAFFQRGHNSFTKQLLIVASQIEMENRLAMQDVDFLLCDRSIADHWAYTVELFPSETSSAEGALWRQLIKRHLQSYDLILKCPIEFPPEDDGVRESDLIFQRSIDSQIDDIYRDAGILIDIVSGSREDRLATLSEHIDKLF